MEYTRFPRATPQLPQKQKAASCGIFRRTGCASADVATGRGVLNLRSSVAFPAGVSHIPFAR